MTAVELDLLKKYAVSGPRYTSYPPAPVFSEAFGWPEYVRAIEAANSSQRPLSLYVHIPYCRSLCWFCGCNRVITHRRENITTYLNTVCREIVLLRHYVSGHRAVVQLHWGGGSPSYLDHDEKTVLMRTLQDTFDFANDAEISLELDPRDLRPGDAQALRTLGFNRVSFGIQDLHPAVQQAVNRIHSEALIGRVFEQLRAAGYRSINVDLMYGLPRQNLATFTDTIDKVVRMQPDRIALFNFAYLPGLLKHQRMIQARDLPSGDDKLRMLHMAITTLTASGYVYIGLDHFAKPDDELCEAQRNKTLTRNFQGYSTRGGCDLLAFGSSAIAQIDNVYAQNHKSVPVYCSAIDAGMPATSKGYRLHRDDQIRYQVIQHLMCHLEVDKAEMSTRWHMDFDAYFAAEMYALRPLADDGLVELHHERIQVTTTGRLFLRNIAMVFDVYLRQPRSHRPQYSNTV